MNHMFSHYCGWLRNPAPVDRWFVPLFTGFQPSKVAQDFATIHSINHYESLFAISPFNHYRNHFLEITSYNSIEISCFPHSLCIKSHRNHWNHQFFFPWTAQDMVSYLPSNSLLETAATGRVASVAWRSLPASHFGIQDEAKGWDGAELTQRRSSCFSQEKSSNHHHINPYQIPSGKLT